MCKKIYLEDFKMRRSLRWIAILFAIVEVVLIGLLVWILKANQQGPAPQWASLTLWGLVGASFVLGFLLLLLGGRK